MGLTISKADRLACLARFAQWAVTRLALLCAADVLGGMPARLRSWPPGAVSPDTRSKIFLPGEIIQQPLLGLVAGSQSADPAAAFEDGQPGLVRAGDSRDPPAHLCDEGITDGSDHVVVVADLAVT